MCAYLLQDHAHQGAVADWLDARFDQLHHRYEKWLGYCLDNRGAVMLFALVIFVSLPALYQLTHQLIDFDLRSHVDPARRLVEEKHLCVGV